MRRSAARGARGIGKIKQNLMLAARNIASVRLRRSADL